ncbi:MAG: hypothetical protein H0W96_08310 [Solirubrobacterales bacterium]|nr:hypothetical protein [Solirubrobacterales bacterium]
MTGLELTDCSGQPARPHVAQGELGAGQTAYVYSAKGTSQRTRNPPRHGVRTPASAVRVGARERGTSSGTRQSDGARGAARRLTPLSASGWTAAAV